MSDIVSLVGELTAVRGQRDALIVEIERLHERLSNALDALNADDVDTAHLILYEGERTKRVDTTFHTPHEWEEQQAEIERLRGALEAVSTVEGNITESAAKKDAEIERLRAASVLLVRDNDALASLCEDQIKEISELNKLISVSGVDKLLDQIQHMEVAIANSGSMQFAYKQEQEIERLRGDMAAMNDSVAVAAKALNDEERENERLRGLLRECCVFLEIGDDDCDVSYSMGILLKRIREALGE